MLRSEQHRDVRDFTNQVEFRRKARDCTVEEHEVLDIEHEFLGELGAVTQQSLYDSLHLMDHLLATQGRGVDRRLVEPEVADDGVEVGVYGERPKVAECGHLALHVIGRCAQHETQECIAAPTAEPADDAVVKEGGSAVWEDKQVAAVEVAVKDAFDDSALHERDHCRPDNVDRVNTSILHADHVVEVEAMEPLHHEYPSSHERRVRARDDVALLAEIVQHRCDIEHVRRFHAKVELFDNRFGEQFDERRRVSERRDRNTADQVRGEPRHDAEVLADVGRNGRPLDLDNDFLTRFEAGDMNLSYGRCGQRGFLE